MGIVKQMKWLCTIIIAFVLIGIVTNSYAIESNPPTLNFSDGKKVANGFSYNSHIIEPKELGSSF